jgi:hypothetical protein
MVEATMDCRSSDRNGAEQKWIPDVEHETPPAHFILQTAFLGDAILTLIRSVRGFRMRLRTSSSS